ncbi:deaminase [Streptomyces sp. NBC_00096]|uniref:deaminase n=1 Tax=Streptomyces sp. NBC_00096 TaxID=2975650 RepID=UPI003255CA97
MLAVDVPESRLSRPGWMQAALRQASRSGCRYPMGAVLVHGNRILAAAPNKRRNAPSVDFRNSTFHAEVATLRRARRTEGATMYVARVDARLRPAMARPCRRCQQALWEAGVQRVFYTDRSGAVQGMAIVHGP